LGKLRGWEGDAIRRAVFPACCGGVSSALVGSLIPSLRAWRIRAELSYLNPGGERDIGHPFVERICGVRAGGLDDADAGAGARDGGHVVRALVR